MSKHIRFGSSHNIDRHTSLIPTTQPIIEDISPGERQFLSIRCIQLIGNITFYRALTKRNKAEKQSTRNSNKAKDFAFGIGYYIDLI